MQAGLKNEASIYDVAREAGVSISTVSRVINGLDRVAPETRQAVEIAVKNLKYRPNNRARALSRKRTDIIGLVVPDFCGYYFGGLMEGVDEEARKAGFQMIVSKAHGSKAKIELLDRLLNESRVDGIILMVDEMSGGVLERLKNASIPLVILDKDVEHRHLDNVLVDNRTGARDATEHLIKVHGITNLLFIGGPTDNVDSRDRADGFRDALREAGIEAGQDILFNTDYQFESGFALSRKLIPRLKEGDNWGIVAANDNLAQGLISGFIREGIQVPEDVAVIGHDDSELAILSRPRLTTVRVPLREIGQSAVKTILEQLADPSRDTTKTILRGKLIIRESCGCKENIVSDNTEIQGVF